jgi:hypothetical protein
MRAIQTLLCSPGAGAIGSLSVVMRSLMLLALGRALMS